MNTVLEEQLTFSCPSCGRQLTAPLSWGGKTVMCPTCVTHMTIPGVKMAQLLATPEEEMELSVADPDTGSHEKSAPRRKTVPPGGKKKKIKMVRSEGQGASSSSAAIGVRRVITCLSCGYTARTSRDNCLACGIRQNKPFTELDPDERAMCVYSMIVRIIGWLSLAPGMVMTLLGVWRLWNLSFSNEIAEFMAGGEGLRFAVGCILSLQGIGILRYQRWGHNMAMLSSAGALFSLFADFNLLKLIPLIAIMVLLNTPYAHRLFRDKQVRR